jgi:hypothetical protein
VGKMKLDGGRGREGIEAESTYSRCIFSRPFKNGFNNSCVSAINCTCLSKISGLVRYAIAALICSLLKKKTGWVTLGVTCHFQ